jgi:5'-3' exonuclease
MGGYLTDEGVFDAARLERILARLAALEEGVLAERCVRARQRKSFYDAWR